MVVYYNFTARDTNKTRASDLVTVAEYNYKRLIVKCFSTYNPIRLT